MARPPRALGPLALLAVLASVALLVARPRTLRAHEVPASVTVLGYVRPDGRSLRVVLRVPLAAIRDVTFPLRGAEYLDVTRADAALREAASLWVVDYLTLYEDGAPVGAPRIAAVRASLPSDRSFERWETAIAHVAGPPLPAGVELPWRQAMLDVALEYPIAAAGARFAVRPAFGHLGVRTTTVLRFRPAGGAERAFRLAGDPGVVRLDPRWHQAAAGFVALGVRHILAGADHLLFLLCLVVPLRRRWRPLAAVVSAFTVAHSITLAAAALGLAPDGLWFPPLVEALVALSILYMALENAVGARVDRRWVLAFGFGLVHGFAFSFALRESMQLAGSHLVTALVSFNVGVEVGQLAVVVVAVPALATLLGRVVAERAGTIVISALVAHTAWHWTAERVAVLRQYRIAWPALDRQLLGGATTAATVLVAVVAALWGLSALADRLARGAPAREAGTP